ncbi:MAG: hypothetical protein HY898_13790 [Deltaproteobacteria bacterium]|nr:hypothetical protein [Deltaproteobacteria bacterium]
MDAAVACCREVLRANNAALGILADIQAALAGEVPLSSADMHRLLTGITVQTCRMIVNLNRMTNDRYKKIVPRFERIQKDIARTVQVAPVLHRPGLALPLEEVDASLTEVVGQKSALLGEASRVLGAHVPRGCATTVEAYHAFMSARGLDTRVAEVLSHADMNDLPALFEASATLTHMVESEPVPSSVCDALQDAVAALGLRPTQRFAVRSSALQEGGHELSFAGQYRSLLNVPASNLADAFRQVVASKYSPQALTYRLGCGLDDSEVAMCCCVIEMLDPVAAGVLYTDWAQPDRLVTLLQAVRGLGLSAVDGSAEPDSYSVARKSRQLVERKLGRQRIALQCSPDEGTHPVEVNDVGEDPILSEPQVLAICDLAWRLQSSLKSPIDMEWALAADGRPFVLQVRPQRKQLPTMPQARIVEGARVLLQGGSRASGGAAAGPICRVAGDLDSLRCPAGAVLVLREAQPRFAVLLPKVAAVVADMGEVTGHLATVARELHVPALFATRSASSSLREGAVVTVDADSGVVYDGVVQSVLTAEPRPASPPNPNVDRLRSVADWIIPLTLRDRLASGYSPGKCNTLHDIIRFCHQSAIEAMFELGDRQVRSGGRARRLQSSVPVDCRLIDLGGGLRDGTADGDVRIEDVACQPMRALWKGMTDPRLEWNRSRPVSLRGFMSAVVNYNFDQDRRVRDMGEPSYAFITSDYLSLNSRIGYHFSTVDARTSDAVESNHLSFRFVGGATGIDQRSRRATLLQRLLESNGFETDCRADLVNARIRRLPIPELLVKIEFVGLLIAFANHLDMALVSDTALQEFESAFHRGDYGYKGCEGGP